MTETDFIAVMRRDDTREMLSLMETYYAKYFGIPGWTNDHSLLPEKPAMVNAAHDMIRLANSIARPARELLSEITLLKYENSMLKDEIKQLKRTNNTVGSDPTDP